MGVNSLGSESAETGFVDEVSMHQNLIDLPRDDEMRVEENAMEVVSPACPTNVSMGWGSELSISQI